MFSQLSETYKERVLRLWQTYANDRLVVIEIPDEPMEILSVDPHEAEFMRDTGALDPGSTISSTKELPVDGEVTGALDPGSNISSTKELPVDREVTGYLLSISEVSTILIVEKTETEISRATWI